jgi:hypothetical protein
MAFQHALLAPATRATFHRHASLTWMLSKQRQREAVYPGEILAKVWVADSAFVLAVCHVETPMAAVLNTPMTSDRASELFYLH